jgi:hypothetical protein
MVQIPARALVFRLRLCLAGLLGDPVPLRVVGESAVGAGDVRHALATADDLVIVEDRLPAEDTGMPVLKSHALERSSRRKRVAPLTRPESDDGHAGRPQGA